MIRICYAYLCLPIPYLFFIGKYFVQVNDLHVYIGILQVALVV